MWVLVPARGGSRGIPRKNLRLLGNRPLIVHTLDEMRRQLPAERIVVSTDSAEIARAAEKHARIHLRDASLADDAATLDQVAVAVGTWLLDHGASRQDVLITVQPTSPFLRVESVIEGAERIMNGARSVISVRRDPHLRWGLNETGEPVPLYSARVNRQQLPATFTETGGIIGARIGDLLDRKTRVIEPIALLELDSRQALDIDDYSDWAVAEFFQRRRRIAIRADASPSLGSGHAYRALALAEEFAEHDLRIITRSDGPYAFGFEFLDRSRYPVVPIHTDDDFFRFLDSFAPDIVALDVLDTEESYVQQVKSRAGFTVSFEDLGPGARLADIVINDLYTDFYPQPNHWYGVEFSILAPAFDSVTPRAGVGDDVQRVLVTFGGTDERNLSLKALMAVKATGFAGEVIVVCGPGYRHADINLERIGLKGQVLHAVENMATLMQTADIAITSAGRTVTELMVAGVPTIVMCQNLRELRHTHASGPYGVINLGLGEHVAVETLAEHVRLVFRDPTLRAGMVARARQAVRGRSNRSICERILRAQEDRNGR